ncbi:MAG: long-chain fatty acid--CoA ligase [bacterium]
MRPGTRTYAANPADLPRGTLVQLFFEAVDRHDKPDAMLYKAGGEWRSISHRQLEADVRAIALGLEAYGIVRGDRVALLSENRPEWAMADYAVLCLGAIVVPIYATLLPHQIEYLLRDSGARAIFVSTGEQLEKVRRIRSMLPPLELVVVFDDVPTLEAGEVRLREVLERGRAAEGAVTPAAFRARALEARPDDVATILYTSGTTGEPKGVMLTHNNIFSNVQATTRVLSATSEDVALSLLPLSHIFERTNGYFQMWNGVTIAYAESLDAVPQNLLEVRPTIVPSVPRLYEKIYARVMSAEGVKRKLVLWAKEVAEHWADAKLAGRTPDLKTRLEHALADRLVFAKLRERTGGRLRFFVSGGAPLDPGIARFFYGAGVLILEGYGLTETSPVTNVNTPEEMRIGTVGKPVPGTEIMIADDGEILVRGPQVMKGYYNRPAATAEAIDADGWFHTGDIGELDDDGFLRITDRKRDIIVTAGGKNIAPQPIENRVKLNPWVAEAVMIGDRRPYPVMLIVPDFAKLEAWAVENGIRAADRAGLVADPRVRTKMESEVFGMLTDLARFEMPKKIALLPDEFTIADGHLTPSMKVKRRVVMERYRRQIEALYEGEARVAAGEV